MTIAKHDRIKTTVDELLARYGDDDNDDDNHNAYTIADRRADHGDDPHHNYTLRMGGRCVPGRRKRFRLTEENAKQVERARGILISKETRDIKYTEALNIFLSKGLKHFFLEEEKRKKKKHS